MPHRRAGCRKTPTSRPLKTKVVELDEEGKAVPISFEVSPNFAAVREIIHHRSVPLCHGTSSSSRVWMARDRSPSLKIVSITKKTARTILLSLLFRFERQP